MTCRRASRWNCEPAIAAAERAALTEAQRDGRACLFCGNDVGPMVPVGELDAVQVFACAETSATCPRDERGRADANAGMARADDVPVYSRWRDKAGRVVEVQATYEAHGGWWVAYRGTEPRRSGQRALPVRRTPAMDFKTRFTREGSR